MQNYLTRRLLLMVPTVVVVSLVIFYMFRLLPGDVALNFLTDDGRLTLDREQYDELRAELGLDRALFTQYLNWLWDMVRLNGGTSLVTGEPVFNDIARKLPVTAELAALSLLVSFAIAIPVGVIGAIKQDSIWDYLGRDVRYIRPGNAQLPGRSSRFPRPDQILPLDSPIGVRVACRTTRWRI